MRLGKLVKSRRLRLSLFFLMGFGIISHVIAGIKPDTSKLKPRQIQLTTTPISFGSNKDVQIFDKLKWNGGLKLSSPSRFFGGYSGLAISGKGTDFVAVSDGGTWLKGKLNYQKDGKLKSVDTPWLGPLRKLNGAPVAKRRDKDAEAITLERTDRFLGRAYISFEHNHRIGAVTLSDKNISAPNYYLPLNRKLKKLHDNAGVEALTKIYGGPYKGALLLVTQSRKDKKGNIKGWYYFPNGKTKKLRLTPAPLKKYSITDVTSLPNGDLLLLERRFKFFEGIQIRIRHIPVKDQISGKPVTGTTLLHAKSFKHKLDNMEGIAAHKDKNGHTIITLISDDNFNGFQNTLLLQFVWK